MSPTQRWLFGGIAGGALLALACSGSTRDTGPWRSWNTLRLEAYSVPMLSGNVEMRLSETPEAMVLQTSTEARFLGAKIAESRTESRINLVEGRTESYTSLSKRRGRRYTFGQASCTVERLSPVNGAQAPIEEWEITSSEEFAYPTGGDGKPVAVFDYYGMLMHLRDADLHETGDEITVHVATSSGIAPYRIVVSEERERENTFTDLATQEPRTMTVRELRLRIIPADPERSNEGFLKMEGETELWVEADSKTLLNLKGKVRNVPGTVELALEAMG